MTRPLPWFIDNATAVPGYRSDPARMIDDDGYLVADVPAGQAEQIVSACNATGDQAEAQRLLTEQYGIQLAR